MAHLLFPFVLPPSWLSVTLHGVIRFVATSLPYLWEKQIREGPAILPGLCLLFSADSVPDFKYSLGFQLPHAVVEREIANIAGFDKALLLLD